MAPGCVCSGSSSHWVHLALCRQSLCSIPQGALWAERAAARCRDCVDGSSNICEAPPQLLIHQYLHRLDAENPAANLISLKAYLLTQACWRLPATAACLSV